MLSGFSFLFDKELEGCLMSASEGSSFPDVASTNPDKTKLGFSVRDRMLKNCCLAQDG